MKELTESRIIKNFQRKIGKFGFLSDDVEFFRLGKDNVVLKIDTLVESTDVPPGMKLYNVARKSIVSAVSDFASKGVSPKFCLVSITLPKSITERQVNQIASGLRDCSHQYGFKIIGGDTNEGKEISISIVLCGISDTFPMRRGAKVGDRIFVTGYFGYASSGIQILLKKYKTTKQFRKKAISAVMSPKAQLDFGKLAMRYCNSSMDSSDGLSTTLVQIAKQSKKQFIITHIPTTKEIIEFANSNQIEPKKIIFDGGEEYEVVFTVSRSNIDKIKEIARKLKVPIIEIGYVKNGKGVFLKENKLKRIREEGWQHFKSNQK